MTRSQPRQLWEEFRRLFKRCGMRGHESVQHVFQFANRAGPRFIIVRIGMIEQKARMNIEHYIEHRYIRIFRIIEIIPSNQLRQLARNRNFKFFEKRHPSAPVGRRNICIDGVQAGVDCTSDFTEVSPKSANSGSRPALSGPIARYVSPIPEKPGQSDSTQDRAYGANSLDITGDCGMALNPTKSGIRLVHAADPKRAVTNPHHEIIVSTQISKPA